MNIAKYEGILAEPIYREDYWVGTIIAGHLNEEALNEALRARWKALFVHYGIEYEENLTNGVLLAIELAERHVPCFQIFERRAKAGRPSGWSYSDKEKLVRDVDEYLERNPSHSILDACRNLLKTNRYGRIKKPDALRTKYTSFKNVIIERDRLAEKLRFNRLLLYSMGIRTA